MSNSKNQTASFDKRAGTTDKGKEYEDSVTALLSFILVRNKHVENFQLSSNNEKYGDFDDIVLEVNYKSQETRNFAIQLKHKEKRGKKITKDMLAGNKGDFSLQKYIESFKKITANGNQNNFNCILYTNATFEYPDQSVFGLKEKEYIQVSTKRHTLSADDFLNTSDNDYVYQFEISQNMSNNDHKAEIEEYEVFFKHFFFYPNQKKVEKINESAQQFFMDECQCEKESFRNYKDFINSWSKLRGKKNALNRKIINLKIGECLLKPSSMKIQMSTKSHPTFHLLQEAFLHFDVTIVQTCDNRVNEKIKEVFAEIQEPSDVKEVSSVGQKFCIIPKAIKSFDELDLDQLATILWYMGKLPLILQVDEGNKKILKQAEEFCQQDGKKKKFIFIGENIKRSDFKNSQVFQNLQDLSNNPAIFENIVQKIEISLQGRDPVSLKNIIRDHPGIQETFSTVELINASNEILKIGEKKEGLPYPYIDQLLPKYVTDFKFFTEKNMESLSVINCHNKLEVIKKQLTGIKFVKVETFLKDKENDSEDYIPSGEEMLENMIKQFKNVVSPAKEILEEMIKPFENVVSLGKEMPEEMIKPFKKVVVVAEDQCSMEDFERICKKSNKTCHLFNINSRDRVEWITSKGSPQELRKHQEKSGYIQESEIFKSSVHSVNLITAKPGMGKSVMLKYLKNNVPSNFWIVHINFREHIPYFEKKHNGSQVMKYFLDDQAKRMKYDEFEKKLQHIFESTTSIVFLWDGLDELPKDNLEDAMKVIEDLSKEGFKNWITARDYLQTTLEDKFNIFASTIKIMDKNQQELYIRDSLKSKYTHEQIEDITKKITTTIDRTGDLGFLGIPLHISILTELFFQDAEKYNNLLEGSFTLSDMLESSVEEKFNFCYRERCNCEMNNLLLLKILKHYRQHRISQYEKLALKSFLPKDIIDNLDVNCEELLSDIKSSKDDFGIITRVDDNGTATFIHNIYGEFFVANWMAKNILFVPQFKDFFFEETYNNIRLIFDIILAKNCPAHLAVLYKNFADLQERSEEEINQRDEKGRSPLHLACSWGEKRPILPVRKEADSFIIDDTAAQVAKEDSSEYVNILHFLTREKKCNPFETDALFQWNAIEYADSSLSLSAIEVINKNCSLDLKNLQKFSDNCNILYYGIKFGYMTLLEKIEIIPYIEVEVNRNNLLHEAIIYERNDFLEKILGIDAYSRRIDKKNCEKRKIHIHAALPRFTLLPSSPSNPSIMKNLASACLEIKKAAASACQTGTLQQAPLHTATTKGNIKAMEILFSRTNNPYILDSYGNNSLHLAVMHQHMKIVEMLLERGFKKDELNNFHQNILHIAAKTGNWNLTNYILKLGVTSNKDAFGCNPIDYTVLCNHQQIMELMLQEMPSMMKKDYMQILLNLAVVMGSVDITNILIRNGAHVDENQSLYRSDINEILDAIRLATDFTENKDTARRIYRTPLNTAISIGELEIAKILIQEDISVNNKSFIGTTPLHWAARLGIEKIVKLLLEKGVKLDEPNYVKMTPLHEATKNNHLIVVKQLLEAGASCNKTDQEGTPLLISLRNGHKEIAEFLIQNRTRYDINVDIQNSEGLNPLLLSVLREDLYMIKLLLENGADTKIKYNSGDSIIHKASVNVEVLKLLIQHRADVNMVSKIGATPLHIAIFNEKKECANLLIKNGAHVPLKDILDFRWYIALSKL